MAFLRMMLLVFAALVSIACYKNKIGYVVEAYVWINYQNIPQSSNREVFFTADPFCRSKSLNPFFGKGRQGGCLSKKRYLSKRSLLLWSRYAEEEESNSNKSLPDVGTMRIKELKEELDSYGIPTSGFLEKSELVDALQKARAEGRKPINRQKKQQDSSSDSSSNASSASDKQQRLVQELEKCQQMKVSDLKKELSQLGVSTKTFFEKSEFVRALAEARVEGVKKRVGDDDVVVVANNVEVLGANDAGPQKRSSRQQQDSSSQQRQSASPFGGMGGFADIFSTMGGGGGGAANIADMFAGGGANMADIFSGMGGAAGAGSSRIPNMAKFQQMMKNPKVIQIIAKAQNDPRVMSAIRECIANPMAMSKYQNDPTIRDLLNELRPYIS
jgi:hypothetical protein